MNKELHKSLCIGHSRAKKSKSIHYIIPAYNGYSISKYIFSILNIKLFYSINQFGTIFRHDDGEIFNLGQIDFFNVSAYI